MSYRRPHSLEEPLASSTYMERNSNTDVQGLFTQTCIPNKINPQNTCAHLPTMQAPCHERGKYEIHEVLNYFWANLNLRPHPRATEPDPRSTNQPSVDLFEISHFYQLPFRWSNLLRSIYSKLIFYRLGEISYEQLRPTELQHCSSVDRACSKTRNQLHFCAFLHSKPWVSPPKLPAFHSHAELQPHNSNLSKIERETMQFHHNIHNRK